MTSGYDGMQINAAQDVTFAVPPRARTARFSWELSGDEDARSWAIHSVASHRVQAASR